MGKLKFYTQNDVYCVIKKGGANKKWFKRVCSTLTWLYYTAGTTGRYSIVAELK